MSMVVTNGQTDDADLVSNKGHRHVNKQLLSDTQTNCCNKVNKKNNAATTRRVTSLILKEPNISKGSELTQQSVVGCPTTILVVQIYC